MIQINTRNLIDQDDNYNLINDILLSDSNPFLRHYNEGLYNLDCWQEYLGITANITNQAEDYLTYKECVELAKYLTQHISVESIYIGNYAIDCNLDLK